MNYEFKQSRSLGDSGKKGSLRLKDFHKGVREVSEEYANHASFKKLFDAGIIVEAKASGSVSEANRQEILKKRVKEALVKPVEAPKEEAPKEEEKVSEEKPNEDSSEEPVKKGKKSKKG